ncbi:MAG: hypothetical protein ACO23N_03300 [Opitutales bacterium]
MADPECSIRLAPPKVDRGTVRLEGWLDTPGAPPRHLYFEFTCPDAAQARLNPRPFVLAFLPVAMRLGLPLRCEHPIDRKGRDQLELWQACFAAWLPTRLSKIELRVPTIEPAASRAGRGAITAFSGGSDSCLAALTYPRDGDKPLAAGLMIHGFDIPCDDPGFEGAWENSRDLLTAYGLQAYRLRTNIREPRRPRICWERESHGIWLAAALACLEPWFDALVIPSSYPTRRPRIPYGSNQLTDPLLGTASAPVIHQAEELRRAEKFARLARDPHACGRMRVCFASPRFDRNCGKCFKCVTTQVLLWSHGVRQPGAFPVRATCEDIRRTQVEDRDAVRLGAFMREVREAAATAGLGDVVSALDSAIEQAEIAARREERRRRIRNVLLRILGLAR